MKGILAIVFCIVFSNALFAKEDGIDGRVIDEKNLPVPYATVMLRQKADSTLYKGEVTDESGEYHFENVKPGEYFLQIQSSGYAIFFKQEVKVSGGTNLSIDEIKLSADIKQLKAVTIEGEKPFIEREADKMTINIDNSIVHAGASLMEVFEKLPGVIVDQDGNIRVRGKQGVRIYIDEKATTLSGQDLVNMLNGMSSSNIQKIEIITNPSAKWDAAGNAGIINIVMKKNKLQGYNGNANINYGQGRYPKFNTSAALNYKSGKIGFSFNYAYANRKGFNNLLIDRKFYSGDTLKETFLTNNYLRLGFVTHNPRLGIDYAVSDKTTISILTSVFANTFKPTTENHTDIYGEGNERTGSLDFSQSSEYHSTNYEFNTRINHDFDTTGQSLTVNLDYGKYTNNSDQYFYTLQTDVMTNSSNDIYLSSNQLGELYLYSAKADYSKPLPKGIKFESGIKSSLVKSDRDSRFFDGMNDSYAFDSAKSSHFLYRENINAAYISFQKKFNSLTVQAGLRTEQTIAEGLQKLNNQSFDKNYTQVFPTLYLNYDFGKQNLNLNIGRRINRPDYESMNPYRYLIDYTTYSEGNPYLSPELTYVTELSYSYDNTYFVTLNYSHTYNSITDVLIQDAQTRTTIQSIVNLYELNYYSIDLSYTKRIAKWWKTNTDFQGYYARFAGIVHNYSIDQGDPSFSVSTNNNISITENLSAELSARFNYQNLYGVTLMRNTFNLTAGIQQSVFNKKGTITINMTDIFWKAWPRGFTEFGDVTEDWISKRDTRVFNVGFAYNFGKGKAPRIRRETGADEEKQRIK
jgi:hypothetical protein